MFVLGIIHNGESSEESDTEIDLERTEVEDYIEAESPVVDNKTTAKLLHHETACSIIDDD